MNKTIKERTLEFIKYKGISIARVIDYVDNPEKYKEYIELRSDIMMMRG